MRGAHPRRSCPSGQVWAPDAVIEVQAGPDAPPQRVDSIVTRGAYFRGSIADAPGSAAMLAVHEDGRVQGMAFRDNATWAIGKQGADTTAARAAAAGAGGAPEYEWHGIPLTSKKANELAQSVRRPFTCGNNASSFGGIGVDYGAGTEAALRRRLLQAGSVPYEAGTRYTATVAFETDGACCVRGLSTWWRPTWHPTAWPSCPRPRLPRSRPQASSGTCSRTRTARWPTLHR